jgi:hypothetical protein
VVTPVKGGGFTLQTARPIAIVTTGPQPDVDPKSLTTLRAIALELARHPDWTLGVGVRPGTGKPEDAEKASLERAMLVANRIGGFAHRPSSTEAVGWDAVKQQPSAATGIGLVVLVTAAEPK